MAECESAASRAQIRNHFAGRISSAGERKMRAHLAGCADCRGHYERYLVLAEIDPAILPARERLGRGLGVASLLDRASLFPVLAATAAATCAVLLLVVAPWQSAPAPEPSSEFAARGPAASPATAELVVYRTPAGGKTEPLAGKMRRDDELSFAYQNRQGWSHLSVFGVDESGKVFWYYPAWLDPAAVPNAVVIRSGSGLVELPDAVSHALNGKRLRLVAIFSNSGLSVRDVEARLAASGGRNDPLFEGTLQRELSIEVE